MKYLEAKLNDFNSVSGGLPGGYFYVNCDGQDVGRSLCLRMINSRMFPPQTNLEKIDSKSHP